VPELASERGRLLVEERLTGGATTSDAATRRWLDAVASAGGGRLTDAIRRDATGGVRRLLDRTVWLPDLDTCLALQAAMPAGWLAVPRDGSAAVDDTGVALGAPESLMERRGDHARLASELERAEADLTAARSAAAAADEAATAARSAMELARADEGRLTGERRGSEEAERTAARELEAVAREAAWHEAQLARLDGEVARLREAVPAPAVASIPDEDGKVEGDDERTALTTWESRAAELRDRRDRLAARLAGVDAERRDAEHARARAEASAAMAEERVARSDRESEGLVERETALVAESDGLRSEIATATTREAEAREALGALHAADAADRSRLSDAERAASAARERLRAADDRVRAADHAELEARLGLESLREGVLVELAGLGELGLASLGVEPATAPASADGRDEDATLDAEDTGVLEAALAVVAERWEAEAPSEPPPAPGRLAHLRRRYHELGAANPFAVEEYAELKARLDTLETQGDDLRAAIGRTRQLIAELDEMIATQFRATFSALETAFERRFEQLFDGGFAKLSLTDPSDLGSTGVEIVARPPGKKPQALAMLSGGERALTAVALLFAMLEVRPVPFCVLDEVDAALDEANIGRFAEALRSLAHQTQFIVITHNRGTIESADALYGVTVGDDSVSRVISLRLDEAQALASERRGELSAAG
jgi:chromosome segregation protein